MAPHLHGWRKAGYHFRHLGGLNFAGTDISYMTVTNHERYYKAHLKAQADGGSGAGTPPSIPAVKDRSRPQKTEGTREWAALTMEIYDIKTVKRKKGRGRPPKPGYDIERMLLQEMVHRRCV